MSENCQCDDAWGEEETTPAQWRMTTLQHSLGGNWVDISRVHLAHPPSKLTSLYIALMFIQNESCLEHR